MIKIATWNINSVRLRADLVARFLTQAQPDILCLQEIKCREEHFPRETFLELGYTHIAISGQPGYHGVATVSKFPLSPLPRESFCGTAEARHLGCTVNLPGDEMLALHNIYVPAGGDIPDPALNPKFKQKLSYLESLAGWRGSHGGGHAILLGDFNVAPLETDVWSHKQLLKVVSHTPVEVEALTKVQNNGEWCDLVRRVIPARPETLHLVELSCPRLGGFGPGAPPRPHLGQCFACRKNAECLGVQRSARLGRAVGSRSGHGRA